MKLDHTPTGIIFAEFGEWLDYVILGAEELGRSDPEERAASQALYDRPLTERQLRLRKLCKEAASRYQGAAS